MIRVFKLGDVVKNLVKIIILIIGIIAVTRFFYAIKKIDIQSLIDNKINNVENKTYFDIIDENIDRKVDTGQKENLISKELNFIKGDVFNKWIKDEGEKIEEVIETAIESNTQDSTVQVSPKIEVVSKNNKKDVYNLSYKSVKIRNQTSFKLTEDMIKPNINFDKSNIIIYHTHTSESYTKTEANQYKSSGNFRTLDKNYNVIRVGEELKNRLASKKINVVHNCTVHDYPEYNGSYNRSLKSVQNVLKNTKADFIIDLHRDAMGDSKYGPSVMIGNEKAAQLMLVVGSNEGGLEHPNWKNNLKCAIKIQEKANEMYPGLFKPIMISKYRYNQHVSKAACIIEVGATGNTLEECLVSMKYLAEVISQV